MVPYWKVYASHTVYQRELREQSRELKSYQNDQIIKELPQENRLKLKFLGEDIITKKFMIKISKVQNLSTDY